MGRAAPLTALAGAVLIWSTTFVVSADALATASPAVLTVARFALAVAVLVPLAARLAGRRALRQVCASARTAALGLTGVAAYYGLQNLRLSYTTAGTAALLQAVLPVATAALATAVLRERLTSGTVTGLVLATVGIVLVASADARVDRGAVLVVTGVLAYAVYTVLLRAGGSPGRAALPAGAGAVAGTLYLGLVASGGTLLLWTYGAARTPASVSGVLTAAVPALGYGFAVATGEPASWLKTAGGACAVGGVLLAARAATRGPAPSRAAEATAPSI